MIPIRLLVRIVLVTCALSGCVSTIAPVEQPSRPPNVVLFIVDDLGWRDVGFMGSALYETPHIDALAARGMVFTNAYSASPVCSPSRAAIMTGQDPVRFHITDWMPGFVPRTKVPLADPDIAGDLPLAAVTIAEHFRAAGYATGFTGKWHLGETEEFWPQNQGFDVNTGGWLRGGPSGGGAGGAYFAPHRNPTLDEGPEGEFLTTRLGEETINFIAANAQRPFLAVHAFYQVHTPLNEVPGHIDRARARVVALGPDREEPRELRHGSFAKARQDNAVYASMVAAMDETVGRIVARLEREGLLDQTIIVFASDNGGLSHMGQRDGDAPTSNAPLRGTKGWLYEGGIRVPLAIVAPDSITPGSRDAQLTTSIDLLPTIAALAGLPVPQGLDGIDLRDPAAASKQRALYWHFPHYHATGWRPGGAVREGNFKLIEYFEDGSVELFDLAHDPGETNDIAPMQPATVARLRQRLRDWRASLGARMPVPDALTD